VAEIIARTLSDELNSSTIPVAPKPEKKNAKQLAESLSKV